MYQIVINWSLLVSFLFRFNIKQNTCAQAPRASLAVTRFAIAAQQREDKCTNKETLPASTSENADLGQQMKTEEFHQSQKHHWHS